MTREEYIELRRNGASQEEAAEAYYNSQRGNRDAAESQTVEQKALTAEERAQKEAADREAYYDYLAEYYKGIEDYGGEVGYYSHLNDQFYLDAQAQAFEAVKARGLDPNSTAGKMLAEQIIQDSLNANPDYLSNKQRLETAQTNNAKQQMDAKLGELEETRANERADRMQKLKETAGGTAAWLAGNLVPGLNFARSVSNWQKEQNYPEGEPLPDDWFRQYVADSARSQLDTLRGVFGYEPQDDSLRDAISGGLSNIPSQPQAAAPAQYGNKKDEEWWNSYNGSGAKDESKGKLKRGRSVEFV